MSPSPDPFLLFFYAEACPSSVSMMSVLRGLQQRFGEKLPCIVLDINSPLAKLHYKRITVAPTLLLMRQGTELWRGSGLLHTSEVVAAIERVL